MSEQPVTPKKIFTERRAEDVWQKYWRPGMGYSYMAICLFDFIIAPILTMLFSYYTKVTYNPWTSLTLQSGGFVHLAFGAICGVSAYGRTQEKLSNNEKDRP